MSGSNTHIDAKVAGTKLMRVRVSEDTHRLLKSEAALCGEKLPSYVASVLEDAVNPKRKKNANA